MSLIKSGKTGLLFRICSIISFARKNCKLEILTVILGILWISLCWRIPGVYQVNQIVSNYFNESRCSGISGFASVVIGIYVTVWSVFATSASKINAELLKNRVEGQLFLLIGLGIVEAFITTMLCVFVPNGVPHYSELMALSTALTAISFVKFVVLIMMITKLNLEYIVQEIDEQIAKCTEAQVKLDEIYRRAID